MPPTLLAGKTAEDMHNQLRNHPVFQVVHAAIQRVKESCEVFVSLQESDSAASNAKLIHSWFNKAELKLAAGIRDDYDAFSTIELLDWSRCHSHQNFLLSAGVLCLFPGILSAGYRMVKFMETSHHMRLYRGALMKWYEFPGTVSVRKCNSAPSFSPAVQEFIDYMSRWGCVKLRAAGKDESDLHAYKKSATACKLTTYFSLCPESLTQLPVHMCSRVRDSGQEHCCANLEETIKKLQTASDEPFVRRLQSPETNKWTNQWPSFDFIYAGSKVHTHQMAVWDLAFARMEFDRDNGTRSASYSAQQGTRCRQTSDFLHDGSQLFNLECYIIACEAVRSLTLYFFLATKAGVSTSRFQEKSCIQCDLINPAYSILVAFQQYMAGILFDAEGSGRLLLMWDGMQSFESWVSSHVATGKLRCFRRAMLQTGALSKRRHDLEICGLPWSMLSNVDTRQNPEVQEVRAHAHSLYDEMHACCCSSGLLWFWKTLGATSLELASTPRR